MSYFDWIPIEIHDIIYNYLDASIATACSSCKIIYRNEGLMYPAWCDNEILHQPMCEKCIKQNNFRTILVGDKKTKKYVGEMCAFCRTTGCDRCIKMHNIPCECYALFRSMCEECIKESFACDFCDKILCKTCKIECKFCNKQCCQSCFSSQCASHILCKYCNEYKPLHTNTQMCYCIENDLNVCDQCYKTLIFTTCEQCSHMTCDQCGCICTESTHNSECNSYCCKQCQYNRDLLYSKKIKF
jgi:hypothetical protein